MEIYLAYVWLIAYHSLFEFSLAFSSVQVARKYVKGEEERKEREEERRRGGSIEEGRKERKEKER